MHTAMANAKLFREMEIQYKAMSTLAGFRSAVLSILNLRHRRCFENLKDRQLADLLYRDQLTLKHSSSAHIRKAVATLDIEQSEKAASSVKASKTNGLAKSIIEFLIEVRGLKGMSGMWAMGLSWPWGSWVVMPP